MNKNSHCYCFYFRQLLLAMHEAETPVKGIKPLMDNSFDLYPQTINKRLMFSGYCKTCQLLLSHLRLEVLKQKCLNHLVLDPEHSIAFMKKFKQCQVGHNLIVNYVQNGPVAGVTNPYFELYEASSKTALVKTLRNMYVKANVSQDLEYVPTKIVSYSASQEEEDDDDCDSIISTASTVDRNMYAPLPAAISPLPTTPTTKHSNY